MTRTEQFEAEAKQRLNNLKKDIDNFDRTNLDENQIQELARAEKVLKYLLAQTNLIDTDLLPQRFFKEVAEIQDWESRDIATLNNILDSCLIVLNKYRNFDTVKEATFQNITDMLNTYHTSLDKSIKALNLNKVKKDSDSIQSYEKLLNSENGIKAKIQKMQDEIQSWFSEIQKFNNAFFVKQDNKETSIKTDIENARNETNNILQQVQSMFENFIESKSNIDNFNKEIFGKNENGKEVGGLKQELESIKKTN